MKKLELKEGVVYHMCEIGIENLSLNSITSNRKDKKQIDDKLKVVKRRGCRFRQSSQIQVLLRKRDTL